MIEHPRIAFVTTCKGRAFHVKETLPKNMADNEYENAFFLVLDYASGDGLIPYLKANHAGDIASGRLIVYSFPTATTFHVSHAKNLAHRCAMLEGADVLVTVDADNYTGKDFDRFIMDQMEPGIFLTPDHVGIREIPWESGVRPNRGFAGRLVVRSQDFIKAGGYNETYDTWRGEDIDFNARMGRMGYTMRFIDNKYLHTIPHGAEVRFKEYPHAKQYEREGAWKVDGRGHDTVVNDGKFGMGTVYRNFVPAPVEFGPVPTRIFGIGLHKTATTSLHKAFQILGFDSFHWGKGEAPLIWDEMNNVGRSVTMERWYAISDLPIPLLYRELDKAYPGSKFILTIRDEAKWLTSVQRLWDPAYNPSRWVWDVYPFSNRIHKALYGTKDFVAGLFLERYRAHNATVLEYFADRPNDLLVIHMGHGMEWDLLCSFLNQPIPPVPFPREYATRTKSQPEDFCHSGTRKDEKPKATVWSSASIWHGRDVLFPGPDHVPVWKPPLGEIRQLPTDDNGTTIFPGTFEHFSRLMSESTARTYATQQEKNKQWLAAEKLRLAEMKHTTSPPRTTSPTWVAFLIVFCIVLAAAIIVIANWH